MAKFGWKSFVGGVLLGSVGLELLRQKGADKVFTGAAAGVLVAKDWVMERVEKVQARSADIYADAKVKAGDYLAKQKAAQNAPDGECCCRGKDE
ncbi:MAG: hypothetical protein IKO91_06885 [Oscillospiraceae bacterium]|nr:hypothetical protein [Oscillospiraceae bacterium]